MGLSNIIRRQEPTLAVDGQAFTKQQHLQTVKNFMAFCNQLWTTDSSDMSDEEAQQLGKSYCEAVDFLSDAVQYMKEAGYSVDFGTAYELDEHEFVLYKGDEDGVWHLHE